MADLRKFKTDVVRELGLSQEEKEAEILQIALQFPSTYHKLRAALLQNLLKTKLEEIYNMVWYALGDGTNEDKTVDLVPYDDKVQEMLDPGSKSVKAYRPLRPESEINEAALAIASGFRTLVESELVEKILPKRLYELSLEKTAAKTGLKFATGDSV